MERHLNLIKTGHQDIEKRVFPRFPFSYLVFREAGENGKSYEVKDISYSGMQISLKDGEADYKLDDKLTGEIHWYGEKVQVNGIIKRVQKSNLGIEFVGGRDSEVAMKKFLSLENIAKSLRPIHEYKGQLEIPANLAYWFRCDGPFEIFVWQHNDNEISKMQIIMMQNFVEWNDGKGLSSGKILSSRNADTPLVAEEEFEFLIDDALDEEKLIFAKNIVSNLSDELLTEELKAFLHRKLGIEQAN